MRKRGAVLLVLGLIMLFGSVSSALPPQEVDSPYSQTASTLTSGTIYDLRFSLWDASATGKHGVPETSSIIDTGQQGHK